MGWNSANEIFDPIARALIELHAPDEMKVQILSNLIAQLQEMDWDTEDESLEEFKDDLAIVEAFRQHEVIFQCDHPDGSDGWCELERDHDGDHE